MEIRTFTTKILLIGFLFFKVIDGYASGGTLTIDSVKTTPSTCANNGTISIYAHSSSGSVLYSIISGPSTSPFQSGHLFSSLSSGTYQLLVTDFNNDSAKVSATVGGSYTTPDFSFTFQNPSCPGKANGYIIATPLANRGTHPFTWELTNTATNITTTQASDTFNNLAADIYTLREVDSCGNFATYSITLTAPNAGFAFNTIVNQVIPCDSVLVDLYINENNPSVAQPYYFTYQTHNGIYHDTVYTISSPVSTQIVPNISYGDSINITVTNACGVSLYIPNTVAAFFPVLQFTGALDSCQQLFYGDFYLPGDSAQTHVNTTYLPTPVTVSVYNATSGVLINSTVTTDTTFPHSVLYALTALEKSNQNYKITITDGCGNTHTAVYSWPTSPPPLINKSNFSISCLDSTAGTNIQWNNIFFSLPTVILTSGPGHIGSSKPHYAYSDTIIYPDTIRAEGNVNGYFLQLGNLAAGTYHYRAYDSCGNTVIDSFVIKPSDLASLTFQFSYTKGCPGQNVINFSGNGNIIFSGVTSEAGYSSTVNSPGELTNLNAGTYILNFGYGLLTYEIPINKKIPCQTIYDTIVIPPYLSPQISYATQVECNGAVNVIFTPNLNTGVPPYKYEITSGPQTFPLQYSNTFLLTQPGSYSARVSDSCGFANSFSFTVDTSTQFQPSPSGSACLGASATLSNPYSPFTTYVWKTPSGTTYIGDSLVINPVTSASYGIYTISKIISINGCKDTLHTTYNFTSNNITQISQRICPGTSFLFGGISRSVAGIYYDTIPRVPCDSIIELTLTIKGPTSDSVAPILCAGQSVTVGVHTYSATGVYRDTFVVGGCDSIVITNLTIKPWSAHIQTLSLCFGQSVTVGAKAHNTTGTFIDTLINAGVNGCDSVVTTNLTIKPWSTYTQTLSLCFGQSVTVGAKVHNTTGTFIDTLINAAINGCDSVVTTNLTIKPWATHTQTLSICFGQSVTVGAKVHNTTGTFIDTLLNAAINGCDSVVTTNLTVKPWTTHTQTLSICFGQSVTVGAVTHSTTGTFIDTLLNAGVNGCDSVVTTNLTIRPWSVNTQTLSLCFGQSVTVGAKVHNTTGTFVDTLINAAINGCDSVVTTNLTIKPWANYSQTLSICFGQSVSVGAKVHNTTGTFIDTLINTAVNGCDSVVTTNLTVKPWSNYTQTLSICLGQSVTVGAKLHNTTGTFIDTLINAGVNGCDSVVTTNLTVKPWATHAQTLSICFGQSVTVGAATHSTTGTFIDTLVNAGVNGCDSVVTTNLTVKPWATHTQTLSICNGQSVTVGAVTHTATGTYIDTLINAGVNGCDSIVTTNLSVKSWSTYTQTLSICFGQSVTVGSVAHSTNGTFIDTLTNGGSSSCDSVVTTNLTILPWSAYTQTLSICFGQSVSVGAKVHNTTGTFIDTLINAAVNGCDSVVTTNLIVKLWASNTQTLSICFGQSVTVGAKVHNTTGTFIDTLINAGVNGCDSVVTTNLIVKPWATYTQTLSICFGQSVTVGAATHSTTGTFIDTLINAGVNGCDSVVTTNLTVKPWATHTQTLTICSGQSITVGAVIHSATGTFIDTLINAGVNGCDSVVTTNLTVKSWSTYTQTLSICFGQFVTVGTVMHNTAGTFIDTLTNGASSSCDSVVTTNLTILPWSASTQTLSICFGQAVTVGAKVHNTTGTFIDTLTNAGVNGCDSVVTTNLTVKPWANYTQTLSICFGQSITVGATIHNTTGTFIDTLINAGVNGCDSVVTTNLTVMPWATHTQSPSICFGQSITVGAVTHNTTGTFIDTLTNAGVNGCDSVVTTNLTIMPWATQTQNLTICNGSSVTVGTVTHNITGTFIDTLINAGVNGCDSIVTTNLTVKSWSTYTQTLSICFGQSVTVGTVVHNTTGTFIDTLANVGAFGCDSVVTTNLTVMPWSSSTQTLSICSGQSVIVGPFVHNTTGTFIDTIVNAGVNGCDSVVTTNLTVMPLGTSAQTLSICFGQSITVGTFTHSTTGTFIDTLNNASVNGCDSVVTTNLTVMPWATYTQSPNICFGQSITVGAVVHNTTGTFIDTLINAGVNGCDSIVTTNVTVMPWATYTQSPNICFGQSITVGAVVHNTTGTFIDTLINAGVNGCDSVVTTNLTIMPWATYTQAVNICSNQSISIGPFSHNTTGTFIDTILNASINGCDSVVTTNLTVLPLGSSTQTLSICSGQSITVGTFSHNSTGTFIDTLANASVNGCDSVVTTNLTVMPLGTFTQSPNICFGQSITVGAVIHNTTGTFIDTLANASVNGCDSVVTTNLTVMPWATYTQSPNICFGQSVTVGTVVHNTTGTFIDTLLNADANGCDSVVTTNLTVMPWATYTQSPNICFGQSITVGAVVHNMTGTFIDTLINAGVNGCDSVVTTNLTVMPWATYTQTLSICFGQSVTVGSVHHNTTGTFIDTLINTGVNGCDSVVTTNLTVMPWATFTQSPSICFGDSVVVGTVSYKTNGTFIDTLVNAGVNGCDSIVTTHLTVNPWSNHSQALCIYSGQSISVGSVIHTTPGTFIDTLLNVDAHGCDSIVKTTLQVITTQYGTQHIDSCYTATVAGVTYSSDTVVNDTTKSICGLDSIVNTVTLHFYDPSIMIVSSGALPIIAGESTQLIIKPSGSYQNIIWSPDYEISSLFALSPTVSPREDTTYYVTAETPQHCIVSAQILIPVVGTNQPDFLMPTAFSPNGDGLNDLYRPVIKTGPVTVMLFQIYDRWGQKVYDSEGSEPAGWDGTFRNVGQPMGVYIYYITAKVSNGSIVRQSGNVTLIR